MIARDSPCIPADGYNLWIDWMAVSDQSNIQLARPGSFKGFEVSIGTWNSWVRGGKVSKELLSSGKGLLEKTARCSTAGYSRIRSLSRPQQMLCRYSR